MALSPYMMRMMGAQMGGVAPGTISGLTQPMSLGVPAVQPLMGAQAMPAMPAMSAGVPEDSMAKAQRMIKDAMSSAPQGIDPDIAAILARREARLAEQEKGIEDKGSVWDRLGRFSTALLANESPFFSVGLGRAVATTLADEQRRREAAMQRRSAIEQSREDIDMERVKQKSAGQRAAMERLKTTIDLAGDLGAQQKGELEGRLKALELEQNPQKFALELQKIRSEIAENVAQANKAMRPDAPGSGREPPGLNDYRDQMSKALKDYSDVSAEYEAARTNPDSLPGDVAKLKQQVLASGQRYNAYAQALRSRYGVNPDIVIPQKGLFAPKTGGRAASSVADPLGIRRQT